MSPALTRPVERKVDRREELGAVGDGCPPPPWHRTRRLRVAHVLRDGELVEVEVPSPVPWMRAYGVVKSNTPLNPPTTPLNSELPTLASKKSNQFSSASMSCAPPAGLPSGSCAVSSSNSGSGPNTKSATRAPRSRREAGNRRPPAARCRRRSQPRGRRSCRRSRRGPRP